MDKIILLGAGGHTRSCIDVIEHTSTYEIAGLIEKDVSNVNENLGYPIIGTDNDLKNLRNKYEFALVTVGHIKSAKKREQLFSLLLDLGYKLPIIVSPRSHISRFSKIGAGTIIMHDVIVNANVEIGQNCIINNKVLIEHDCAIGDNCHIATGAIVNGGVNVGSESFIGSGVITKQYISIGKRSIIGAGKVLKTNVESNKVIRN